MKCHDLQSSNSIIDSELELAPMKLYLKWTSIRASYSSNDSRCCIVQPTFDLHTAFWFGGKFQLKHKIRIRAMVIHKLLTNHWPYEEGLNRDITFHITVPIITSTSYFLSPPYITLISSCLSVWLTSRYERSAKAWCTPIYSNPYPHHQQRLPPY